MRRITIQAYAVGIVYRRGRITRVITEGRHWIGLRENVERYLLTVPSAVPKRNINILLENEDLRKHLYVIDVPMGSIAIQLRDGKLFNVYPEGRYVFWKGVVEIEHILVKLDNGLVPAGLREMLTAGSPLRAYVRSNMVENHQRGLLYINGEFKEVLAPGKYDYWVTNDVLKVELVDMRKQRIEVAGQEILTKDKAAVRTNCEASYVITDPVLATVNTKDYAKQLYTAIQMAVRSVMGALTLDELLTRKIELGPEILGIVSEVAGSIGVEVISIGIKDIILPGEMKSILNQVLIAEKRAQANGITRREETAATRSLMNTAKLMENNDMLYRLKEMEYIERISEKFGYIALNSNTQVADQLKQLFSAK